MKQLNWRLVLTYIHFLFSCPFKLSLLTRTRCLGLNFFTMSQQQFKLCLYIAGDTRKSRTAIENLKKYCSEHLEEQYTIEVIDLLKHPHLAEGEQIIAIPTLIKKLPSPVRILVGDLSQEDQFLVGMNLVPVKN